MLICMYCGQCSCDFNLLTDMYLYDLAELRQQILYYTTVTYLTGQLNATNRKSVVLSMLLSEVATL